MDEAFNQWKKRPDQDNTTKLLSAARPTLYSALTSYAGGDRAFMGRAKLLALDAFKSYDPKKGTQLRSHLLTQLQPLRREYHYRSNPVRVPERAMLEARAITEAEMELSQLHGRPPSDTELADHSGLSLKKLKRLRQYNQAQVPSSFFSSESDEGDTDTSPGVYRQNPQKIWMEYVHHDLSPVDQKILEWKTGFNGNPMLSTNEIARRLKLSPGAISQRSGRIAEKMAEGAEISDVL